MALTLLPHTSINSRSEYLSCNTIFLSPPLTFDLRVTLVSPPPLSQHRKWRYPRQVRSRLDALLCIPAGIRQRKTSPGTLSLPASTLHDVVYLRTNNSRLQVIHSDIVWKCTLININSRYADGDILRQEGHIGSPPILPTTMTSQSPVSSPSWDRSSVSSTDSGLVPDVPAAEPISEQIGFGGMYYEQHTQHSHYHPRWDFKFADAGHGHSASSRTVEHSPDVHVVSSSQLVGSRGEFNTRPLSGVGSDGIAYTDEANSKISNRLRRRCYNCKATETSTWRRSVLSPGKLVGHQGYFDQARRFTLVIRSYATNVDSLSAPTPFHARRNSPEDGRTDQRPSDLPLHTRA